MTARRPNGFATLATLAFLVSACSGGETEVVTQTAEEAAKAAAEEKARRFKEIEQRIKDSMPKTQELALNQEVDEDVVRKVQQQLQVVKEYQDEPSGKIDFVTVNAIQAFQRRVGLDDDGLLDEQTLKELEKAASAAG